MKRQVQQHVLLRYLECMLSSARELKLILAYFFHYYESFSWSTCLSGEHFGWKVSWLSLKPYLILAKLNSNDPTLLHIKLCKVYIAIDNIDDNS